MQARILYQMKGRFIKIEKFGHFSEGERVNYHYLGDVEGGVVRGECRGINYEIIQDRQINIHIHESITTDLGEKILLERIGTSKQLNDSNSVIIRGGQALARTDSKKLSWMNNVKLFWDGDLLWNDRNFTIRVYEKW